MTEEVGHDKNQTDTSNNTPFPFILSNAAYNKAKWLVVIVMPAVGSLYFALSQLWGFPAPDKVMGTIVCIQAFLGVLLGISSTQYKNSGVRYAGSINIDHQDDKKVFSLELNHQPEHLEKKDEAIFKVNAPTK